MNSISLDRIIQRGKEVATLNTRTFAEISRDPNALPEAAIVVATVAISAGLGNVIHGANGLLGGVILSLLGWVISSAIIYFIGTRITGTPTTTGSVESLLRTLGYASAPNVFLFLGFIPLLGNLIVGVLGLWTLVTTVLAIRASLSMSLTRAVLTGFGAMIASWVVQGLLGFLFGISIYTTF
jgi:hypothetical protein